MKESTKSSTAWVMPVVIVTCLAVGYFVGSETAPDCPECPELPPPCLTDGVCKFALVPRCFEAPGSQIQSPREHTPWLLRRSIC